MARWPDPRRPRERPLWLTALGVALVAAVAGYVATCAVIPARLLPHRVEVPALRGTPTDEAVAQLAAAGLIGRVTDMVSDPDVPAQHVAWQSPAPGTVLTDGATVRLGASAGSPFLAVPDVIDLDAGLAVEVIVAAGLQVGRIDSVPNAAAYGAVIESDPPAGDRTRPQQSVSLRVSRGPLSIEVPDLKGLPLETARNRLNAAGLRVGVLSQRFEGVPGSVLLQNPAAHQLVTMETAVDLVVSGITP